MLNKLLQSIGIGGARVDTLLATRTCVPGGVLEGEVRIYGGKAPQDIEAIHLSFMTEYEVESDDHTYKRSADLGSVRLTDRFTVQANQELTMPFRITVPLATPATMGKSVVWVQTWLDIKSAVDPQDRDYLDVKPHALVEGFINAASRLGFHLVEVDSEKAAYRGANSLPFVQEFEFKPYGGEFRGRLDELEAVFQIGETSANVMLQVDRRARGLGGYLAESMGMDESYVGLSYTQADLPRLDAMLADTVRRFC
ncbi:MAG: sporulation protein [Slackia sp.]|nr:sporulation protein [Slackia sp.]